MKNYLLCGVVASLLIQAGVIVFAAEQKAGSRELLTSPKAQEALRSGTLSEKDLQKGIKAVEDGLIDAETIETYRQKAETGSLTPEEIEAGKKLFKARIQAEKFQRQDAVYVFGNVLSPGEYEYQDGITILDILPDISVFRKNTFLDYGLIKRFEPDLKTAIRKKGKDPEQDKLKPKPSLVPVPPLYSKTPDGVQVELITFELGKLYLAKDESQNLKLKPRDEIYIFTIDEMKRLETTDQKKRDLFLEKGEVEADQDFETLSIFGHNLFGGDTGLLSSARTLPVSENYLIGPGDKINVLLWGRLNVTHELEVDNEGLIHFPRIGPLTVAGLTFGELKIYIRDKAEAITGVQVSVSLGQLKAIQVFALGEVVKPGIYSVSSLATISNVLFACQGPTALGTMRNIQLKRNHEVIAVLDMYDLLLHGDTSNDLNLKSGDVIFAPQAGPMVALAGNVKRQAIYELKGQVTPAAAIALAGGLKPGAFKQRIQVERAVANVDRKVLDISLEDLGRQQEILLKDGDRIRVFSVAPESQNAVYLYGNVERPGIYAYSPGARLKDILPDLTGFKKDTEFNYALIKRYHKHRMKAELIPFHLGRMIIDKDESQNLAIAAKDEIYIFHKSLFQDTPEALVRGEVRIPGKYEVYDMKLRDLILKAGDLTPDAYLVQGELIRLDADRNRHTLYFNVAAAMKGDPEHNLTVNTEDEVIIHSVREKNWDKYVSIKGEINNSGRYLLSHNMRLKDLVFKAGGLTRNTYLNVGHLYRTAPKTKQTTLHPFDVERVMSGIQEDNQVLQDMDEVILHSIWDYREKYTVTIQGLVRNPGEYPYAANMTARDLIMISGNVRDAAYIDEAELVRFSIVDGREVKTAIRQFNIRLAQEGHPDHNIPLHPLDVITIKEIPEWFDKKKSITISGEIFFPGVYQIRKDERLSEVIKRSGGFTDYAYLKGAVFTRESIRVVQQSRIDEMMQKLEIDIARLSSTEVQKSLSAEDLATQSQLMVSQRLLLEKLKSARATGRVVVDLMPLDQFIKQGNDLILDNGDTLFIPKTPHTVNVIGAVYNPTALIHDLENPELQYYLDLTGGPTENADEDFMYVIRANGTVVSNMSKRSWWKKFEKMKLDPGDTVIVPEKVITTAYMRDMKDITQILYQIAVTAGITVTQIF